MKPAKVRSDSSEQTASCAPKQEENNKEIREGSLNEASGSDLAIGSETTYLERKALAAQGIWGRVKEMPNGCWEWLGLKNKHGYGRISVTKKQMRVHRLIATIFNGPLLDSEMACHSCGNRACINPKHLAIGDAGDNAADLWESTGRGRPVRLSQEQIALAVEMRDSGKKYSEIAKVLGVAPSNARHRVLMAKAQAEREALDA